MKPHTVHDGIYHNAARLCSELEGHHPSFSLAMQETELPPVLLFKVLTFVGSRELYGALPCASKCLNSLAEQLQTSLTFALPHSNDPDKLASLASWLAAKAKQLQQLSLCAREIVAAPRSGGLDEILAALAEQPETLQLQHLALTGFPLCMDKWSATAEACPHLTTLTLNSKGFHVDSISRILGNLIKLQHLDLQFELARDAENTVNWPPHLTSIRLNCTGNHAPALIDLEGKPLSYLRQLVLDECCLGTAFTANLPWFKSSLTRLVLSSCSLSGFDNVKPADVAVSIGKCQNLRELVVEVSLDVEFDHRAFLFDEMGIEENERTSILSNLPNLPQLTYLTFRNTDGNQLAPLCDLKPLEEQQQQLLVLVFENFRGNPFDLNPLSALTNLARLELDGAENYWDAMWEKDVAGQKMEGIVALECLKDTLRHLALRECHLVPDDLIPLGHLHQLTYLSLAGAQRLGNAAAFRHGYALQDDATSDASARGKGEQVLEALVGLHELVHLDLRATFVESVSCLGGLPKLTCLQFGLGVSGAQGWVTEMQERARLELPHVKLLL